MCFCLVSTSFVLDATSVQVSHTKLCLSIIFGSFFSMYQNPPAAEKDDCHLVVTHAPLCKANDSEVSGLETPMAPAWGPCDNLVKLGRDRLKRGQRDFVQGQD